MYQCKLLKGIFVSKTYFKLDDDWITLFTQLNERIAEYGIEELTELAKDYADGIVPDEANEYQFESAVHFFCAIYFIWRNDPSTRRIKLKHINKFAESMMDTVTELTENPKEKAKLELNNFLRDKVSEYH